MIIIPIPSSNFVLSIARAFIILMVLAFFIFPFVRVLGSPLWWLTVPIVLATLASLYALLKKRWWLAVGGLAALIIVNAVALLGARQHDQGAAELNSRAGAYARVMLDGYRAMGPLVPNEVYEWVRGFERGVGRSFEEPDQRELAFEANWVLETVAHTDQPNWLDLPGGGGAQAFLQSYEPIVQEHGDWLGLIADCDYNVLPKVSPRLACGSLEGIEEAYGIDLQEAMARYLERIGQPRRCAADFGCQNIESTYRIDF